MSQIVSATRPLEVSSLPMDGNASVESWEVTLQSLTTPVGLKIAAVHLAGSGASIATNPFTYQVEEEADLEALIHEADLEAFIRTKVPDNVEAIAVSLEPGKVVVKATVRVLLAVNATAVCTLAIKDGTQVFVELESVEMLGAGVKSLVQKQIDAINPVLDVADWPLDVTLDEIRIEDKRLVAVGRVAPPPPKP